MSYPYQAWLERSLDSLGQSLIALGSRLVLRGGEPLAGDAASGVGGYIASQLMQLADQCGAIRVFYHRAYTPDGSREEDNVRAALAQRGIDAVGLPGHLLYEPNGVDMSAGYSGGHWGTLMPFLRACERSSPAPPLPLPSPSSLAAPPQWPASASLSSLALAPAPIDEHGRKKQRWATKIMSHWQVGDAAALEAMRAFVSGGLARYESDRSRADQRGSVSTLSPCAPTRLVLRLLQSIAHPASAATFGLGSCLCGSCTMPCAPQGWSAR